MKRRVEPEIDDVLLDEIESRERYGDLYPDIKETPTTETPDISELSNAQPSQAIDDLDEMKTGPLDFSRVDNAFLAKNAGQWLSDAAQNDERNPLFGDFWNEGKISFLIADSGMGKSLLAVQIAESIASGKPIPPFTLKAKRQRVLLLDFELDDKQFELRYRSEFKTRKGHVHFKFSDDLIRAKMGNIYDKPDNFRNIEHYIYMSIEYLIKYTQAKAVIIDNITWLSPATDNTAKAASVMKNLKYLKTELGISILVIAHTPKRYKFGKLELNDLQGSKILANFADNVFGMGKSRLNNNLRYLKHLKSSNGAIQFDAAKVCTIRLSKQSGVAPSRPRPLRAKYISTTAMGEMIYCAPNGKADTFLGFEFVGYASEHDHIGSRNGTDSLDRLDNIAKAKLLAAEGLSIRQISTKTGLKPTTIHRHLKSQSDR